MSAKAGRGLLKVFGVGFGLAILVGNTVGSGILRAPSTVAARLPNPLLIVLVWCAGGLYALFAANALAELGTMLPRSGAQYVYVRHALGPYAGFVVGWSDWMAQSGGAAALSLVIAGELAALMPGLASYTVTMGVAIVVAFTLLMWRSARWSDRVQGSASLLKGAAFIVLLIACFTIGHRPPRVTEMMPARSGLAWLTSFVVAFQAVTFTYDGWAGPLHFAEELRDPGRDIPSLLFGGLALIILLYVSVNVALIMVLPIPILSRSDVAAVAAARAVVGVRGDQVVHLLVVVALVSAVSANLLMASRVAFALARDGLLPRAGARVNAGGTPIVALAASTALAIAFVVSGAFDFVVAVLAIFFISQYSLSLISLFVLRRREPGRSRPWRALGHPWSTGAVLVVSAAFLIAAMIGDPWHSAWAGALVALSYPVYRLRLRPL